MRSIVDKLNRLSRSVALTVIVPSLAILAGCDPAQQVGPGAGTQPNPAAVPGGTATVETGPIVRFTAPTQSLTVADDQISTLQYSVDSAIEATVALFLDPDATHDNGNEIDLAAGLSFQPGVTSTGHDLIAGFFPYGTYFIKARATDGTKTNVFNAAGVINIVPGGSTFGSDDGLENVEGLQLLHDSGKPKAMNRRIPFVDTWHVLDVVDNLAPRMIVPIEFSQDVELHRIQFYVFGIDEPAQKRVEIYRGTNENTAGEQIHQIELNDHLSRRNGWWNTVVLDPPMQLTAGNYGFSYHAALEFTEHWAGNAPEGEGYAWASPVQSVGFSKITATEFGFTPNFGIRVVGKFTGKNTTGGRARLPDRRAESDESARAELDDGTYLEDPTIYRYPRDDTGRFHIVWRRASSIGR